MTRSLKRTPILTIGLALVLLSLPACKMHKDEAQTQSHKIVVTNPVVKDVVITQQYVCQIHSRQHIKVCAIDSGYLDEIRISEGQAVKKGDLLFKILPTLYQAKLDAELAEARLAALELNNANRLLNEKIVSPNEILLFQAKLAKAEAKASLAKAELNFTEVRAKFDGIVDRLHEQNGSLIKEGDVLTTLSDNSVMWVYFNVPEATYLDYMNDLKQRKKVARALAKAVVKKKSKDKDDDKGGDEGDDDDDDDHDDKDDSKDTDSAYQHIELVLANGQKFNQTGKIGAIEAQFNNETGNIPFRADFPNPKGLLRYGQTGSVLIHKTLPKALVIPQRATFEILDHRYVYIIDKDNVVHRRKIVVQNELEDLYVIKSGLEVGDKIVLDGVGQVHDGSTTEYEVCKPEDALANLKHHAE